MFFSKKQSNFFTYMMCFLLLSSLFFPAKIAEAKVSSTKGIDVSSYNGVVDWDLVAEQGYTFAMIRIAEGQAPDVDKYFEENYAGAKAAGLKVGVYHDCCIRTPEAAALEAAYCLELLNGRPLDYPVAYDMEKTGTFAGGKENTTEIARVYCEVIKEAGYVPMIYSYASRLNTDFDWDLLAGVKIWVAHYEVEDADFNGIYDIWQYSANGWVDGANTDKNVCDLNYSFMEAESISLSISSAVMGVGESVSLTPSLLPEGCTDTLKWKSSDSSIASVSQKGKITAKKAGNTTIRVTTGSGQSASVKITVKKAPKSVEFSIQKKTIGTGTTYQLKPVFSSGTASYKTTYTSSNKAVASVSSKGLVTGKKAGTTNITMKTFNGKTAVLKLVVK